MEVENKYKLANRLLNNKGEQDEKVQHNNIILLSFNANNMVYLELS